MFSSQADEEFYSLSDEYWERQRAEQRAAEQRAAQAAEAQRRDGER